MRELACGREGSVKVLIKMKKGFFLAIILAILLGLMACNQQGEPESAAEDKGEPVGQEDSQGADPGQESEETGLVESYPELLWTWEHEESIRCLAPSPDGKTLAVGSGYLIFIHELTDGALLNGFEVNEGRPDDMDISPDGLTLALGLQSRGVLLMDLEGKEDIIWLHSGYDNRVAFLPDGETIATANRDGQVWTWKVKTGEALKTYDSGDAGWVTQLDVDPSGKRLAATQWIANNPVRIWDLEKEEIIHSIDLIDNPADRVNPFRFSRAGEIMAGAVDVDGENQILFWKLDDGSELEGFEMEDRVRDMDFSPDGKLLAVITAKESSLWEVDSRTRLYTLDQGIDRGDILDTLSEVRFTPDGGHIAIARGRGHLELWKLPDAKDLQAPPLDIQKPLSLPVDTLFDTNSAVLKKDALPELEKLASLILEDFKEASLTFIGHTDSRGEAADNQQLSLDQAEAVKAWFEDWATGKGEEGWTLSAEGRGCSEPKIPDLDPEGIFIRDAGFLNRRIEILLEAGEQEAANGD